MQGLGKGQKQTLLQQLAEDSDDDEGTDAFSDAGSLGGWDEEEEDISPEDQRALAAFMVSLSTPSMLALSECHRW